MNENERLLLNDDAELDDVSERMERDARRYDMAYTEEAEVRMR